MEREYSKGKSPIIRVLIREIRVKIRETDVNLETEGREEMDKQNIQWVRIGSNNNG